MIGVIAAMSGKVKGDGETHDTIGKVLLVEGIALLSSRETAVLADRPWLISVLIAKKLTKERK